MTQTINKTLKGKYGKILVIKSGNQVFRFRQPTIGEMNNYLTNQDAIASNLYLYDTCLLNKDKSASVNPNVLEKFLKFVDDTQYSLTKEGYQSQRRKPRHNILRIIILIASVSGIPFDVLANMSTEEFMEVAIIVEDMTETRLITFDEDSMEGSTEDMYSAVTSAQEKIERLKQEWKNRQK